MEEIREKDPVIQFGKEDAFHDFLGRATNTEMWIVSQTSGILLKHYPPGTVPPDVDLASSEQLEKASSAESLYLRMNNSSYLLNTKTAMFTLKDRVGLNCRLTSTLLEKEELDNLCNLLNEGWKHFDGDCRALVRGGQVLALHSAKYCPLSQEEAFQQASEVIEKKFPAAKFESAVYTHGLTTAEYSLTDHKGDIMREYAKAWTDAGLSLNALQQSYPILRIGTSDTGEFCFSVSPVLLIGHMSYSLGNPLCMKHNGKSNISDIKKIVDSSFTKLTNGIENVSKLIQTEMFYPVPAIVAAAKEAGLTKVAKKAVKVLVENFKMSLVPGEKTTAWDIYTQLCEIRYTSEFTKLTPRSKICIDEDLYRLLILDWNALDAPGPEDV